MTADRVAVPRRRRALAWLAFGIVLALATGCSGGAASGRAGGAEPVAAPVAVSVSEAPLLLLADAYVAGDRTPVPVVLWPGEVPEASELPGSFDFLPEDTWGECEPGIYELPAELGAHLDVRPPGPTLWLVHEGGACAATVGEPVVLVGQSWWLCEVVIGFRYELQPGCPALERGGQIAPVAVVAEHVRADLRWVPAEVVTPELGGEGLGPARLSYDGVASELALEPFDWQLERIEHWQSRTEGEEADATLSRVAAIVRVATPREAFESRWVSWYAFAGDDPSKVDCSCFDYEAETDMEDCVTDFFQLKQSHLALVREGQLTLFDGRWEYPRGGLVEQDAIAVVVGGYHQGVALHRRVGPAELEWSELVFAYPHHEEDGELRPVHQAPYCGP
jgi:hypothetical protein